MPRLSLTVPRAVCPLFSALLLAAGLCGCHSGSANHVPASWSRQADGSWKYVPPPGATAGTVPGEYWVIREADATTGQPHAAPAATGGLPAGLGPLSPVSPSETPAPSSPKPIAPPPPGSDETAPPPPQLREGGSPTFPEIRPQTGVLERFSASLKSMLPGSDSEQGAAHVFGFEPAAGQLPQTLPLSASMPSTGPWHDGFANPVQLGPLRAELETTEQPQPAVEARRVVAWSRGHSAAAQGWGDQWQATPSSLGGRMEVPGPATELTEIEPWPFHPDRMARQVASPAAESPAPLPVQNTAVLKVPAPAPGQADSNPGVLPAPRRHRVSSVPPLFPIQ